MLGFDAAVQDAIISKETDCPTDGFVAGLSIYREIRVFPRAVGNTGKYREIPGNIGKYREIGNQWAHN